MAVGAGKGRGVVEHDRVMLSGMGVAWNDSCVAKLTISRAVDGAPLEYSGDGSVASGAGILVDVNNKTGCGMACCGADWGLGEGVVGRRKVVSVI